MSFEQLCGQYYAAAGMQRFTIKPQASRASLRKPRVTSPNKWVCLACLLRCKGSQVIHAFLNHVCANFCIMIYLLYQQNTMKYLLGRYHCGRYIRLNKPVSHFSQGGYIFTINKNSVRSSDIDSNQNTIFFLFSIILKQNETIRNSVYFYDDKVLLLFLKVEHYITKHKKKQTAF